jgi:O-antigen/teichoic acid export membrane protein
MRALFALGLPLGIAAVLNNALLRIDTVMLQAIDGSVSVAMYGVAYRFFESFLFVGWGLPSVVMSRLSRLGTGEESARLVRSTAAANLVFYVPLAAGAPFAADELVRALFSERFDPAADAVPWLTAAALFYALAHLGRHASIALGRGRAIAWTAGGALTLNVVLNSILIPRYSFEGAAVATLISEVVEAAALGTLLYRSNRSLRAGPVLAVPLVAGAAMVGVLLALGLRGIAAVAVGAPVYVFALIVTGRVMAPHEARMVRSLLRRPAGPGTPEQLAERPPDEI